MTMTRLTDQISKIYADDMFRAKQTTPES